MIITCPDCSTHYTVDAKTLGQSGRKVRCASCGHNWFATPEAEQDSPAPDAGDNSDQPVEDEPASEQPQDEEGVAAAGEIAKEDADIAETEDPQTEDPAPKTAPAHRAYRDKLEARAKRKRVFVGLGAWGGVAAGLVLIAVLAVFNRTSIVKMIPNTAGTFAAIGFPVNIWGVDLKDIKSERSRENGEDVLRISGQIYNDGDKPRPAPLVRISLRDETDEEIHAWTVPVNLATIPPKTGAQFITVVRNPPFQAVNLRFSLTESPLVPNEKPNEKPKEKSTAHEVSH